MKFACLCCGFLTLDRQPPGSWSVCPVCFWEDDYAQGLDTGLAGGANELSLDDARRNFAATGSSSPRFSALVRLANKTEFPLRRRVQSGEDEAEDE